MKKKIGIYVDTPNLWAGTKDSGVKLDPKAIKKYGESFGEVKIAQAYLSTPAKNPNVADYIMDWGCKGFKVVRRLGNGKNGRKKDVDLSICTHMMNDLYKQKDIEVFVLVSGDSDFEVLVKKIKEEGKKVIVIAPSQKCAGRSLIEAADDHLFYSDLVEQ